MKIDRIMLRWALPTSLISTVSAVFINLATELKSSWIAWAGVVVLMVATAICASIVFRGTYVNGSTDRAASRSDQGVIDFRVKKLRLRRYSHVEHHHDRRGIHALTAIVVLLIGVGVYAWNTTRLPVTEEDSAGVPVAATVDFGPRNDCISGWVAPDVGNAPIPVGSPPSGSVLTAGGTVTVTVQGLTEDSVVLQRIDVDVITRRPAVSGVYLPSGCGSDITPRYFRVDLTEHQPSLKPEGDTVTFPYKVSGTDPEQFIITPLLAEGSVEWRLRILWSSGDQEGEIVIDDGGEPLRNTVTTHARLFCVEQPDGLRWIPHVTGASC